MKLSNTYLVAPLTDLTPGATMRSRSITVHETHDEAVAECERRSEDHRSSQKFVVYRAISLVGRTARPVTICDIEDDGAVIC